MMFLTLPDCPGGGASVGPLQNFGGVGREDQCWGHFTTGVSMRGSREAAAGWHEQDARGDCV